MQRRQADGDLLMLKETSHPILSLIVLAPGLATAYGRGMATVDLSDRADALVWAATELMLGSDMPFSGAGWDEE